jgi:PBS lyase HEAT-like repeat
MNGKVGVAMVSVMLISGPLAVVSRSAESAPAAVEAKPGMDLSEAMRSKDRAIRDKAYGLAANERSRIISALIESVRNGDNEWERTRAMGLLGQYRAVEAVPVLIENLDCPPGMVSGAGYGPFEYYPAALAILKIGDPAVQEILLHTLAGPVSDRHLKVFAYVIWYHYSPVGEQEVGLFRLRRLLAEEKRKVKESQDRYGGSGPSVRERNLARLVDLYEQIRPNDRSNYPPRPERPR